MFSENCKSINVVENFSQTCQSKCQIVDVHQLPDDGFLIIFVTFILAQKFVFCSNFKC